jgi:polyisoprenoid-binding protein YceI
VDVVLQGRFSIHGVTREASLPATVLRQPAAVRLRADAPLSLKDYQVEGLSKMMGMLKMSDRILLHIDVTFVPGDSTVGSARGQ